MSKPTIPYWDKNETHLIAPVAGHVTDGFVLDEIPGSNEVNGQWNLIGKNIAYLREQASLMDALVNLLSPIGYIGGQQDQEMTRVALPPTCWYAIALHGGSAYPRRGSANNKVLISAGTLLQLISNQIYMVTLDNSNEVTIANGDATNPRVDIVQMKIDLDAETQVATATFNVKQGTPAASPTYPTPDTGYCIVAGVVVGATYAAAAPIVLGEDTAGAVAVLHDQRMPLGVKPVNVKPKAATFGSDWALAGSDTLVQKQNNNASNSLLFTCDEGGYTSRLLAIAQGILDKNTQDPRISRLKYVDGGAGATTVTFIDLAGANIGGSGSNQFSRRHTTPLQFQTSSLPLFAAGPVVQANADGVGAPIWTNGRRCVTAPYNDLSDGNFPVSHSLLTLRWVATGTADSGSQWGAATFWIAGGL